MDALKASVPATNRWQMQIHWVVQISDWWSTVQCTMTQQCQTAASCSHKRIREWMMAEQEVGHLVLSTNYICMQQYTVALVSCKNLPSAGVATYKSKNM